jgi:peroxiredoxin
MILYFNKRCVVFGVENNHFMKKLVLIALAAAFFYSCQSQHRCPTYNDSGAKWNKHGGHPYAKHH